MTDFQKTLRSCLIVIWIALALWITLQTTIQAYTTDNESAMYQTEEEPEPFLAVPYFGAAARTAYMDNNPPNYRYNGIIQLYDQRAIPAANGACGYDTNFDPPLAMAYHEHPNSEGECIWYDGHTGHDFGIAYEPILAAARGTVVRARWANNRNRLVGLGLFIEIEHENGYYTRYGHMSAIITKTTDLFVTQGQIIGTSGNTGNSGGPHLHFEVLQKTNGIEIFADPFSTTTYLWDKGIWFAGQWSGRQLQPSYNITHVVENHDHEYFKKGTSGGECAPGTENVNCPNWYPFANGGVNDSSIYVTYASNSRNYWATWTPPEPGQYLVEAYIPNHSINPTTVVTPSLLNLMSNLLTWGARYCPYSTVYNDPIPYCVVVDQLGSQGRWIPLGNVWFGDDSDLVRLYDQTLPSAAEVELLRRVGVDALRFRGVILDETVYLPIVQSTEGGVPGQ